MRKVKVHYQGITKLNAINSGKQRMQKYVDTRASVDSRCSGIVQFEHLIADTEVA